MIEKIKDIFSAIFVWGIIIFIVYGIISAFGSHNNTDYDYQPFYEANIYSSETNEEIEKPDGTYTVEACNTRTGNCYDLDADISDGLVETIYFLSGGHLDLDGAELDEDGYGVGESYTHSEGYDGDEWEVNCYDCY